MAKQPIKLPARMVRGVTYGVNDDFTAVVARPAAPLAKLESKPTKRAKRAKQTTAIVVASGGATPVKAGQTERDEPLTRYEKTLIYGPGEPLRVEGKHVDRSGRPRSVWTAILRMKPAAKERMCLDFYGMTRANDRAQIMGECVLFDAQETDRVTVTREGKRIVKWSVWVDPKGIHRLEVFP